MDKELTMEYNRLGKSGLKISKVIFGCMSFGSPDWQDWIIDEGKLATRAHFPRIY